MGRSCSCSVRRGVSSGMDPSRVEESKPTSAAAEREKVHQNRVTGAWFASYLVDIDLV